MNLKLMGLCKVLFLTSMLGTLGTWAVAQDSSPAPDNTKVNERDRNHAQPTADQQKSNPSDREITRQIRQAVVKDGSLSTYAHNVKIIAQNGAVTLRGPVRSDDEKRAVEAHAAAVVGQEKVTSELEVKPKQ
ncbi:MAG TPA: BON domain-containing protein [Candidatus Sulfotelmatobacter sp.]